MMDLIWVQNPKKKNIKNMYVNNFNYFHKNNIKMRYYTKGIIDSIARRKKIERIKNPMPKMLYATSNFFFHQELEEKKKKVKKSLENTKPIVEDLIDLCDKFSFSLDSDNEAEKVPEKKEVKKNDFFITKPTEKELTKQEHKIAISSTITDQNIVDEIRANERNFKDNLQLENFEKYKFSKTGIAFPKKYKKYEVPKYTGDDKEDKEYFDYRTKIKYPNLVYNKIDKFSEKFNKDLGTISNNYGKIKSRTRFTENPLLKKYMDMIPIYEAYKDIKYIENRYIDSRFKYKLLPLINNRLIKLDSLADRVYKKRNLEKGLTDLLSIDNIKKKNCI